VRPTASSTSVATIRKRVCRARLVERSRELNRRIQANPNVTDADRAALGLTIPKFATAPVGRPDHVPLLGIIRFTVRTVRIRLRNQVSVSRGKPESCAGASIYWCAGEEPPTHLSEWTYLCGVTRTIANVTLPEALRPGTRVWLSAAW
jgi:hypothetical protein